MNFEEFEKEVEKNITSLFNKANDDEKLLLNRMVNVINDLSEEKQELIRFLKEEQNRLARECSQIYEDSVYAMKYASQQMMIDKLQKENKILKENAEHNDKVVDKVNWENQLLKKENQQLKGSLQTYEVLLKANVEENQNLKEQQKEFIEWLEKESKEVIRDAGYHQRICEDILEKYKEIVGSDK